MAHTKRALLILLGLLFSTRIFGQVNVTAYGGSNLPSSVHLQDATDIGMINPSAVNGNFGLLAGGGASLELPSGGAIEYADVGGNDAKDGRGWDSAKKTLLGACEALPGGAAEPATCGKGTIYFTDGVFAQPTSTCGLWLMGSTDPNFASPPACWIKVGTVGGFSLHVVGVATNNYGPNSHEGRAAMGGGSGTDINHPGIWISGVNGPLWFENISIAYPGRAIVISQDSDLAYSGCLPRGIDRAYLRQCDRQFELGGRQRSDVGHRWLHVLAVDFA